MVQQPKERERKKQKIIKNVFFCQSILIKIIAKKKSNIYENPNFIFIGLMAFFNNQRWLSFVCDLWMWWTCV